jgi:Glycosyltransferase family 87
VAGLAVVVLVGLCTAAAWPDDSPLVPRNAGHPEGDETWAWFFLVGALAALAAYGAGVLALARSQLRLRTVAAVAVAIQLTPLAAPLLISTDAWTYWQYGRIATVADGNPYRDPPEEFPKDAAFRHIGEDWRDTTSVYGPAFTLASEPVAAAAGDSEDAAAWIYKSLAAAASITAALLAATLASRRALACAFAGWNPLLALHLAGGGHNDAWIAALVVGALALGASGRRPLAGVAWSLAVLVKWVPLLFLPLWALTARRNWVGGFAAGSAAVIALATWRYGWHWLSAFGPLATNAAEETSYAIPHRLQELGLPRALALALCLSAFGAAYLVLVREAIRGRARLALAGCLFLLATPWLAAWYTAWVVPLAAAEEDRVARLLAFGLCVYLAPQAVPV